jgi:parvulin-like peptidyl-prolyl isomerase
MLSARHILLEYGRTKKRSAEEALLLAKDLRERVEDGESFADMAKTYSDCPSKSEGGSLGVFLKGDMNPDFEAALLALKVGQLSQPVRTVHGIHLILRQAAL